MKLKLYAIYHWFCTLADANVFRGKRAIGLDRSQMILKRNQFDCRNFELWFYCVAKRHVPPNEERNTDTPKKPVDAIKVEFSICSQLAHMKDGSISEK